MILSPQQLTSRRLKKRTIDFNLLIIGENGIGKKQFINTLCEQLIFDAYPNDEQSKYSDDREQSLEFEKHEVNVMKNSPIKLTVNLTKNFGFNLNNENNNDKILSFLEEKLQNKLIEENKTTRDKFDKLVHLVLLIIEPNGKGLNPNYIELIKKIQHRCNILILIGKGDLLNEDSLIEQKRLINRSIEEYNLELFNFLNNEFEEDIETLNFLKKIQTYQPFTLINSNFNSNNESQKDDFSIRNSKFRIDLIKHSDIQTIRDIIFEISLLEFKEITNNYIYEVFRTEKLLHT